MPNKLSFKQILYLIFFSSFLALNIAYISEYFFGLKPCILCLYQRIPFFIILFLSIFALFFVKNNRNLQKNLIFLIILLFFVNSLIAFYHFGVEQGFFEITKKCQGNFSEVHSIKELKLSLQESSLAKCDEPQFVLFGLSMAALNIIYCLFLTIFFAILLQKSRKSQQ